MMQKLKEEITAAANRELNRANEQFPLFTSKHEGVAVAYKELEESKEALEELEASFKCLPEQIKRWGNDTRKIYADYYIDDKNMTIAQVESTMNQIKEIMEEMEE